MAKSTHSQEILTGTPDSYTEHETTDPDPVIRREMLGGDPSSTAVGMGSLESSENEKKPNDSETPDLQSPAQLTESPSKGTEIQEHSTVDMTVGGGQKTTPRRSNKQSARSRTVKDEFD